MNKILTPAVRRWVYGVCIAAVPVLIYFQLMPAEAAPVILPLILALLNVPQTPEEKYQAYKDGTGPIARNPELDAGETGDGR